MDNNAWKYREEILQSRKYPLLGLPTHSVYRDLLVGLQDQERMTGLEIHLNYSDRALLVFLLRSFIIRKTKEYEEMQKSAVMPV